MKTFKTYSELSALKGQEVAVTAWREVTQEQINLFAQATDDHQWIHVDTERAAKGPFGTTVAHGFFTLSLLAGFMGEACKIDGVVMGLNYGLNKVRFTSPVPVNSRLRARLTLLDTEPLDNQGLQITWQVLVEREGQDKPVCVAESLSRVYGGQA
ncbi:MaoC family dehydratase [Lampropedia puyangensis]|uniref:MaoC family dehydratase n=1 Tax=Lampropedia puyangensis TaxID=1330072 RepID=A0A4S8ESY9_9BURK|nr:MaoC family dehydratase [Lampropedia puyangensis]THT96443.1 MaoC family dehydratase [Lampropedia puyangensis]